MKNQTGPQVFLDIDGREIKAGDVLFRKFWSRRRERPGHRRVAVSSMGDVETIVNDEGELLKPEEQWITRKVEWRGACMVADRLGYSDFQRLNDELFDEKGGRVFELSAIHHMNSNFDSTVYKVLDQP